MINKTPVYLSALMAGLLSTGVYAQSTSASGSSDLAPKAGEASTQTMGVPNAQTTNSTASEAPRVTKDQARQDAQGRGTAAATTNVPAKAGEASTMVQGKPNATAKVESGKTRAEVKAELMDSRKVHKDHMGAKRSDKRVMGAAGDTTTGTSAGAATTGGGSAGNASGGGMGAAGASGAAAGGGGAGAAGAGAASK